MRFFNKLFKNKKKQNNKNTLKKESEILEDKNEVDLVEGVSIKLSLDGISSSDVGVLTGNQSTDFYVYAWFIKDTGEIFYVGMGRNDRYKDFHERAYEAEKIRKMFDTGIRFVGKELTEEEAIALESKEMIRILNETNDRLTNRIIPFFTDRDNGYDCSPDTPDLKFEITPYLYASEIEEHYYGIKYRSFDVVKDENLGAVVFITRNMRNEIDIIYGGNLDKYYDETKELLSMNGNKILKTKFAKSVTAWIYIGTDYVTNFEKDQEKVLKELGRNIPTYHLLDVRNFLMEKYGEVKMVTKEDKLINAVHSRVPLKDIKNLNNWKKAFDEGSPYWEQGDKERKEGNLEKAIQLFNKARYNGYDAPVLYTSYAMAYRKLKDYDNEIAVIDEAIERIGSESDAFLMKLKERREKAFLLKEKQNN